MRFMLKKLKFSETILNRITDIDKDTPSQLTKDDIIMTCLILCTAEYCMEPLYQV